jgi:hypothetical protein
VKGSVVAVAAVVVVVVVVVTNDGSLFLIENSYPCSVTLIYFCFCTRFPSLLPQRFRIILLNRFLTISKGKTIPVTDRRGP